MSGLEQSFRPPLEVSGRGASAASLEEIELLLSFLPPLPEVKEAPLVAKPEVDTFSKLDSLLDELDRAVSGTIDGIKGWDVERKRLEARQTSDPFTLTTLAQDENSVVRTLAFCNPNMPSDQLKIIANSKNKWFQMLASNHSSTPPEVLAGLAESEDGEIIGGVKNNPNTMEVTRYKLSQVPVDTLKL